jgi:hypothetical protein
MSNHLPPGAIPKLFRQRNKDGKEVGSWYINIQKKPINLRTQDYMKARERAKAAFHEGKRDFSDDRYEVQALLPPIPEPARPILPQNSSNDWIGDVVNAAGNGLKPEVFPPDNPPPIETKATDSNAEYGTPKPEPPPSDGKTRISPEMIDGIIKQAAAVVTELQIVGQEWLLARWGKIQAGPVSPVHESRTITAGLWEQAIREWIPPELPIPPWLLAPLVCAALTIPVQLEGAKPIKKPDEQ